MLDWRRATAQRLEPRGWMLDLSMWLCVMGLFFSCLSPWAWLGVLTGIIVLMVYCSLPWKRKRR